MPAILEEATSVSYAVGGIAQTDFTVPFTFDDADDLVVLVNGAAVTWSLVIGTIDGGIITAGTVKLAVAVTACTVQIYRYGALEQQALFPTAGSFNVATLNREISRLWMGLQDAATQQGLSVAVVAQAAPLALLPAAALRANKMLTFNSSGDPVVSDIPGAGTNLSGNASLATVTATGGTTARTMAERFGEYLHVADFGATGNGTTDDTAALQAAINYLVPRGGILDLGTGDYKTSAELLVDESAVTTEEITRIAIIGAGRGSCRIKPTHASGAAIRLKGSSTGGGFHAHQKLAGFRILGNGTVSGIAGDNLAFLMLDDVQINGCLSAISLSDALSSSFRDLIIRDNRYGIFLQRVDMSYPNAITLESCFIANNTEYGIHVLNPTTFQVIGGSVEGNGWGVTGPGQWGIKCDSAGGEGGVGLNLYGVYFEYNKGSADVWIDQAVNNASHTIVGCSFNRASAANHVGWNIYTQNGAGVDCHLSVQGCAFKAYNDYVEIAGRPYYNLSARTHADLGHANHYGADVAAPRHSATPDFSATRTASTTIAKGSWQKVPFNSATWDAQGVSGCFNAATSQFTVNRRCRVRVTAQVELSGMVVNDDVQLGIYTSTGTQILRTLNYADATQGTFAINAVIEVERATIYELRVNYPGAGTITFAANVAAASFLQVQAA